MFSREYNWIEDLKDNGYKYIIMPKRRSRSFFATKADQTKTGTFRSNSVFDEFILNENEQWIPGDSKNVYINLNA